MPETSIPKPYFCQCKVDIDQSHHIMRRLRSHSPSLSLPSLPLSLSPSPSIPDQSKEIDNRRAASGSRLPVHGFRRTAFGARLSAYYFRCAASGARTASCARLPFHERACVCACVRTGGFAPCPASPWGTAAPAPVRETARPHALLGTAARRAHGTRAHGTRARNQE